jgi:alanyl-tRNA synthetase
LEPGNDFSVQRTLFAAGTPLDVADTTRIGRVVALDILKDLISAHSTGRSYNGVYGLSSIFVYNGRATIRAPFFDGICTGDTMSKDFETYISDILERFRIDKIGLPAFFIELTRLLRRPLSFAHPRYFWDCALTTLALKPPLSRAGLFTGLQRIRRFAPQKVHRSLQAVLKPNFNRSDWREHIFKNGHPLLKKVLMYKPDKSVVDKGDVGGEKPNPNDQYGRYHQNLYSLSIFPRQVNEHGMDKVKDIFFFFIF